MLLALGLLLKNALGYASSQITVRVQEGLVRDLRTQAFAHLLTLDFGYFQHTRLGALVSGIITEVDQTKTVITASLVSLFQNVVVVAVTLVVLSQISLRLTLFTLAFVPLMVVLLQFLIRRLRRHARARAQERAEVTSTVTERIGAIRLIRSYGEEEREAARFRSQADRYRKRVIRTQRFSSLTSPLTEVFSGFLVIVIIWAATRPELIGHVQRPGARGDHRLPHGGAPADLAAQDHLLVPRGDGGRDGQCRAGLRHPRPALDRGRPAGRGRGPVRARDRLRRTSPSATMDGDPVLSEVSFGLPKGRVVALVGPSGAGKTTLADLLPRFHDPTKGRILMDGVPLTRITRRSLRALMGVVSQDTVLLNDTVQANIAYGSPGATRAQVEAAAEAANAAGFIAQLPQGYDTMLGERGTRLSGGQRQRIAIARALLRDPPILILDEATSALDTESERLVQQAIDRLMRERTVLVIAHRLATVRDADEIVVLDAGRVAQRGTPRRAVPRQRALSSPVRSAVPRRGKHADGRVVIEEPRLTLETFRRSSSDSRRYPLHLVATSLDRPASSLPEILENTRILLIGAFDGALHAHTALRRRALERLGCRVSCFNLMSDGGLLSRLRRVALHDRVARALAQAAPSVVLVLEGTQIGASLVAALRRRSDAVWVNWFCDGRRTAAAVEPVAGAYDLVFVADTAEAGQPCRYLPAGCDPSVHRPMRSRDQFRANVVFAGTATPHRERMLSELVEFGLALWGPGWRKTKLRDYCRGELLDHGDYVRAYAGRVRRGERPVLGASSSRIPAAIGACSSWPRWGCRRSVGIRPSLERHFQEGTEILAARSAAEFKILTAEALHDRPRVEQAARDARQRALSEHTYMHRLGVLLGAVRAHMG